VKIFLNLRLAQTCLRMLVSAYTTQKKTSSSFQKAMASFYSKSQVFQEAMFL